jgi:undecaprenyl diphosphate synthase
MSEEQAKSRLLAGELPRHIAIIMDGNGRWAQARGLPRHAGHRAGVEALRRVVRAGQDLDIPVLTLYAFSTENWKRPAAEVKGLMDLLMEYLEEDREELLAAGVAVNVIGHLEELPPLTRRAVERVVRQTRGRPRTINVALNYGGRREIVDACRRLAQAALSGALRPEAIDEARFAAELDTAGQPDPDLLIRTGGELRLSNFLLWQLAYTELYVTPVPWPDFTAQDLHAAILAYQGRHRRFGGTGEGGGAVPC